MINDLSLIGYGCVATVPPSASARQAVRRAAYLMRDRVAAKFSTTANLDFKNHEDQATYNLGDHAIFRASLIAISLANRSAKVTPVNWMELNDSYSNYDALIICGSGYFFLDGKRRLSSRLEADLNFSECHGIPIIVFGAGVNLHDAHQDLKSLELPNEELALLQRFLSRCLCISVRDEISRKVLQSCTNEPVQLIGDPALLLDNPHNHKISTTKVRPLIGLNFAFHGRTLSDRVAAELPFYIETFKKLQALTNCEFSYMIHYDSELVIAKILQDSGIGLKIIRGDLDALIRGYSSLSLHIGGMLHSCILSASTGTPCIGLAYDIKHSGFFDLIKLPQYCLSTVPWRGDLIILKAMEALREEEALRMHILRIRDELRSKALSFMDHSLKCL